MPEEADYAFTNEKDDVVLYYRPGEKPLSTNWPKSGPEY